MTHQQIQALRAASRAIIEACDLPHSAPAGVMYAALMAQGCTLHQFTQIMAGLTNAGMVTADGDCYNATDKGRRFAGLVSA